MKSEETQASLDELRRNIAEIKAELEGDRDKRKRLDEVERELVLRTAIFFVAIDNGKEIVCQGVSKEIERVRAGGLTFSVTSTEMVSARCNVGGGSVSFLLVPGDHLRFSVDEYDEVDGPTTYTLQVFASLEEAHTWRLPFGFGCQCSKNIRPRSLLF